MLTIEFVNPKEAIISCGKNNSKDEKNEYYVSIYFDEDSTYKVVNEERLNEGLTFIANKIREKT